MAEQMKEFRKPEVSLADKAYAEIKSRIISSDLLPGHYFTEAQLCDRVGLGRTPVHQALLRLHTDGLVEIVPRIGVVIQPDSILDVVDVIETRILVEAEVVRRACQAATHADIARLDAIIEQSKQFKTQGLDVLVNADMAFHHALAELAGSRSLEAVVQMLHERSRRAWYLHLWQTLDDDLSVSQHSAVVEALRDRDADAAAQAMGRHLGDVKKRLLAVHENSPARSR